MEGKYKYAKGLYANAPRENAPSFVKGSLSVKPEQFIAFIKEQATNDKGYVRFDLLQNKEKPESWNVVVNEWKQNAQTPKQQAGVPQEPDDLMPF